MAWDRYSRKSSSFNAGGQVYQTGASTYEVRRHSLTTTITVPQGKARIVPLLAYHTAEPTSTAVSGSSKITSSGSKVYPTLAVEEGSRVGAIKLDITIEPAEQSSSNIINFYTGRIMTSFHDAPAGQIYGLDGDTSTGVIKYDAEDGSAAADMVSSSGLLTHDSCPDLTLTNANYEEGDVIKHWWKGKRKNVMFGGQPIVYERWEKVPKKVKRANKGMFYGMYFINSSTAVTGNTDDLKIKISQSFNEVPLIQ